MRRAGTRSSGPPAAGKRQRTQPLAGAPAAAPFRSSGGGALGEPTRVFTLRWLNERGSPSPAPASAHARIS
jgi:hypothetical protein